MSGFAGVFSFQKNRFDDSLTKSLLGLINRNSENKTYTFSDDSLMLCKFDVGAYEGTGWLQDTDGVACLAGDPILVEASKHACNRDLAVQKIRSSLDAPNPDALLKSRGTFCGVDYSIKQEKLTLFTDKLGVRPIYYTYQDDMLYFSTALRVLEQLEGVRRELNIQGAIEYATFDYCLDDHTGYKNIYSLEAGNLLTLDKGGLKKTKYWSLSDNIKPIKDKAEGLNILYQAFSEAVALRLDGAQKVAALLSGGLDSRCVVTELWKQGIETDTFTFGNPKSLDCIIAKEYANKLGLNHVEKEFVPCDFGPGWPMMIANEVRAKQQIESIRSSPRLIWTGDGGSVGVGRVYLNADIVRYLNNSDYISAARCFSSPFKSAILRGAYRKQAENHPTLYIQNYLLNSNIIDPVNRMLVFLMANDQRRHLEKFYENIDLYGIDLCMPFFDAEVVKFTLSFDSQYALYHKMYNDWLKCFPEVITEVAWQHYPGHLPSPLPLPEEGVYQWSKEHEFNSQTIDAAKRILLDKNDVFNKSYVFLCIILTQFRLRNMSWLLEQACKIDRFVRYCNH